MRILLSWLNEYLQIQDLSSLPELMTSAGIEVDRIEEIRPEFSGVVAARVKEIVAHPHASKLVIATVFDGKNEHKVVCGAPNCQPGHLTAYAPVGASLGAKKIETQAFGDIVSQGMLCSEKELGLSDYHDGILQLYLPVQEGSDLQQYFSDTVYEVSITPNLGHCQSIMGVARELGAFLDKPLDAKPWLQPAHLKINQSSRLTVEVQDPALCSRYSALLIDGVRVIASPSWIRIRLERSGYRSINNIVDITNYITQEYGQPLHAFDSDRVHNGHLIVRASHAGEHLTLLDGQTKTLPEETIVIADPMYPLACGGIIGGESSAISAQTRQVIFESASFSKSAIRKTRTKMGVFTEAAKRFERGTDPNITIKALERAYELLRYTCPDLTLVALTDVKNCPEPKKIRCRISRTSKLLGYDVSANEIESAFTRLALPYHFDGQDSFSVTPPCFRHDLFEEVDLIEEVGRLVGLQREQITPSSYRASTLVHHPLYLFEGEVRRRLLAMGLQEIVTGDLISPEMARISCDNKISQEAHVTMLNPLSSEQSVLRPSLLPGFLDVLLRNSKQRIFDLSIFEVGNAHLKKETSYVEPLLFAILLTGKQDPVHYSTPSRNFDFFDLKGKLEELFETLGYQQMKLQKSSSGVFHPGRQAKIFVEGVHVGMVGELHPELVKEMETEQPVLFAECDLTELEKLPRKKPKMQELALYPSSERDWTITLSKQATFDKIAARIDQAKPKILEDYWLVSIFEHEKLGNDRHNVTLHFVYRDKAKTVSQGEVDRAHDELVRNVSHYLAEMYPD